MVGEDRQMNCDAKAAGRFLVIAKTNALNNSLQLCDVRVYATKTPVPSGGVTGVPTPPPTTTPPPPTQAPKPEATQPPPEPGRGDKFSIENFLCMVLDEEKASIKYKGSKSNIPCCALLAQQVRATFA
jgi:hypothetical protein